MAAAAVVASEADASDRVQHGRSLLSQNCAACHAIGERGESPLPAAPTFRSLANRLSLDELFDRLQEGLSSAHRDMPTFRFSREDAHAIRSYLVSIQE